MLNGLPQMPEGRDQGRAGSFAHSQMQMIVGTPMQLLLNLGRAVIGKGVSRKSARSWKNLQGRMPLPAPNLFQSCLLCNPRHLRHHP